MHQCCISSNRTDEQQANRPPAGLPSHSPQVWGALLGGGSHGPSDLSSITATSPTSNLPLGKMAQEQKAEGVGQLGDDVIEESKANEMSDAGIIYAHLTTCVFVYVLLLLRVCVYVCTWSPLLILVFLLCCLL